MLKIPQTSYVYMSSYIHIVCYPVKRQSFYLEAGGWWWPPDGFYLEGFCLVGMLFLGHKTDWLVSNQSLLWNVPCVEVMNVNSGKTIWSLELFLLKSGRINHLSRSILHLSWLFFFTTNIVQFWKHSVN